MANEEDNKFAPGVWEGLAALPGQLLPEKSTNVVGDYVSRIADVLTRPLPNLYNASNAVRDAIIPSGGFTPSQMAEMMQGRVAGSGANIQQISQPAWKDIPMPASAGAKIVQPAPGMTTATGYGAGGGALPAQVAQATKDLRALNTQLSDTMAGKGIVRNAMPMQDTPVSTGTMMQGTGIPGIYQMADGTYVNTPARQATPQQDAATNLYNAIATISNNMRTLPSSGIHAQDAAGRDKDLAALAQFAQLLKPQQTVAPMGGQVVQSEIGKPASVIADNTAAYLQGKEMDANAVSKKMDEMNKQRTQMARESQLANMHKTYTAELEKVDQQALGDADKWKGKRAATTEYLQRIGVPAHIANTPFNVEDYLFEAQQDFTKRGKKMTQANVESLKKHYNEVAKPTLIKSMEEARKNFLGS